MATLSTILAVVSAGVGFVARAVWASVSENKKTRDEMRLYAVTDEQKDMLEHFYYPIYLRLCETYVTKGLIRTHKTRENTEMVTVLQESLFDTHDEIMHILKKHISVARPSRYLLNLILSYMNHVKTYRAFHDGLIDEESYVHFPDAFLNVIERSTLTTQDEYNTALGLEVISDETRFIDTVAAEPQPPRSAWAKVLTAVRRKQTKSPTGSVSGSRPGSVIGDTISTSESV